MFIRAKWVPQAFVETKKEGFVIPPYHLDKIRICVLESKQRRVCYSFLQRRYAGWGMFPHLTLGI